MSARGDNHTIAVVSSGLSASHRALCWERIARCWPGGVAPVPPMFDLEPDAGAEPLASAVARADVTLALLGPGVDPASAARLADLAADDKHSLVVLAADHAAVVRLCGSGGPVVLPWDTQPLAAAAALHALAARQAAVGRIHADLAVQTQVGRSAARELMKLQEEIELAAMLQREMLPRVLPAAAGVELSVVFRPAGMLSGDWYDAVMLDDHHIGVLIADAAGHGVSAALLMMLVSRLLVLKDAGGALIGPGEVMTRLNDAFIERRGEVSSLVSAAFAVIDTRSGVVRYTLAGHPPPMLFGPAGCEMLTDGGPLLGAMPGFVYGEGAARIDDRGMLLLYTDGVEEAFACPVARRDGAVQRAHLDAMSAAAGPLAAAAELGQGLDAALAALVAGIDARHGSLHQADDITMLAIGRRAVAARAAA